MLHIVTLTGVLGGSYHGHPPPVNYPAAGGRKDGVFVWKAFSLHRTGGGVREGAV